MKILELHKPPTPAWLGVWRCSFCGTKIELGNEDLRMKVDYRHPLLWGPLCPGCRKAHSNDPDGDRWERPVDDR